MLSDKTALLLLLHNVQLAKALSTLRILVSIKRNEIQANERHDGDDQNHVSFLPFFPEVS